MKKFLSIFLMVLVIMGLCMTFSLATEVTDGDTTVVEGESAELTDEQLQELLAQYSSGEQEETKVEYVKAKVIDKGTQTEEEDPYYGAIVMQNCKIKVKTGDYKDQEIDAKVILGYKVDPENISVEFKKGENVFVTFFEEDGTTQAYIVELDRTNAYIIIGVLLIIIIALALLLRGTQTIGLMLYNLSIILLGIMFMYLKDWNMAVSFSIIVIAIIAGNVLILRGIKKESVVAMLSVIVSTAITVGAFVLLSCVLKLDGYLQNFDTMALAMIIATLGITIDVSLRSIDKTKKGEGFLDTMKHISKKMPSKYNAVTLVWAGYFINTAMSLKDYLVENQYPSSMLNFGSVAIELVKFVIIILNPIIVMPVSILLSKEILKTSKAIDEPKEKVEEEVIKQ